jgi:hypothetical protein
MICKVHLTGYGEPGQIREVEIPRQSRESTSIHDILDLVFHYGQNEFQPKQCASVSMGDVIEPSDGELWIVAAVGFKRITKQQFDEYVALPRRDRQFAEFLQPEEK